MYKIAINDYKNYCFDCERKVEDINNIYIGGMGYGSLFDSVESRLQLCDSCLSKTNSEWWKLEVEEVDGFKQFKYEEEIADYIDGLSVGSRELFWNRLNEMGGYDPDKWIEFNTQEVESDDVVDSKLCRAFKSTVKTVILILLVLFFMSLMN